MFRRTGKNPQEMEGSSPYEEENVSYKYGMKKGETPSGFAEVSTRIFDPHGGQEPPSRWQEESWAGQKKSPLPHPFQGAKKEEEPETTLGEGVTFRGELRFERLLRIDGTFEGELVSQGRVIVGPKGKVKANLNLKSAVIEGKVEGNITVEERLELRSEASVQGDIKAKSLTVDDGVTIMGLVEVNPGITLNPTV